MDPTFRVACAIFIACLMFCPMPRVASAGPATKPVDTIAINDLLCVGVWELRPTGGERLKTVRVDAQGNVSLYFIGTVRVVGRTFEQAEKDIADAYRANHVLGDAAASVNRLETAAAASVPAGKIAPGDRICVRIFDLHPNVEESRVFNVSDGGSVGLPLLGQFKLGGLTEAEAEQAIARTLEEKSIARNTPVSVLRLGPNQPSEPTTDANAMRR